MSSALDSLVEERVMQLQAISRRRNELLREMYHLVQKRDNLGSVFTIDDDGDDSLQVFLDRFDLEKNHEAGYISNLLNDETALPETPPAYSPVSGPEPVSETESAAPVISESSMSEPPASPLTGQRQEEEEEEEEEGEREKNLQYPEAPNVDISMDVDEPASAPPPEQSEAPEEGQEVSEIVTSREPSQEPQAALQTSVNAEAELHPTEDPVPENSPTPPQERSPSTPYVASSLESPVPHSMTTSYVATREPSSSRASPPFPQDSQSPPSRLAQVEPSAIKAEPLDDEVMEVTESPPQDMQLSLPPQDTAIEAPAVAATNEISKQHSEDQIMAILGPSQTQSSPVPIFEDHHTAVDYFIPVPTIEPFVAFSFENGADTPVDAEQSSNNPYSFGPETPYPLPPMNLLPIEFSRKKASKRKRDKKEEWQPMGLNKWAAVLKANPVHPKLPRASKCLSTRDWSVATTEMRLIRVFERIEQLKTAQKWSFRQPKKYRNPGGLIKSHWDYLMDEMKWMRTDFREERRWKLALAFNIAHAVMDWHQAGSFEERVRRGIVVLWKPPPPEDAEMADASEGDQLEGSFRDTQDTDGNGADSRETGTPIDASGSDEESEDEHDKRQQDHALDSLAPSIALQEALEELEQTPASNSQPDSQDGVSLKPKVEEVEDLMALGDSSNSQASSAMDVDPSKSEAAAAKKPADAAAPNLDTPQARIGLKSSSKNPALGPPGKDSDGMHTKAKHKVSQYAALREHIVYSDIDKLFVDLDDLDLVKSMSELSTNDPTVTSSAAPPPPPHDLSAIFPDLPVYTMFDVAPPPVFGQESRKKSERKGDKDDPNKRADDATYTKLTPTSKFMFIKPTLVGTLKPASNFKNGQWSQIEETPIFADIEVPSARPIEENPCALFEGTGTKNSTPTGHPSFMPQPPRDVRKRNTDHANDAVGWTPAEDALLKQAVERYPFNWNLIADAFNSSRVTIATDRRTAWECLERWREKFSAAARGDAAEDNAPSAASTSASASASHMTTRGYKRSANQSVTASGNGSGGSAAPSEPRKRRRHAAMHDTLRKAAKRREAVQKSNAAPRTKPTAVHDTHGQFTKLPKYTPAELSRMKAEKEARDAQELLMRRRNDELARQHLIREQAQRAQGVPSNAQQAPQQGLPQSANANGITRPTNGVPQAQIVQQIRSQVGISQQQRLAATLANANNRMSPPQLTPAQAAHFRAMAAAQGQGQSLLQAQGQAPAPAQTPAQVSSQVQIPQSNASAALTAAAPALSAAHLSPSFAARATSSSPGVPHQSPPLPVASPANANVVPRPPSVPGQPVQSSMLHMPNMAAQYYLHSLQTHGSRVTPEQLQAILAQHQHQQQQQYAAHAQQQPQNPANGSFPHS